jgi:hypothetical protein
MEGLTVINIDLLHGIKANVNKISTDGKLLLRSSNALKQNRKKNVD